MTATWALVLLVAAAAAINVIPCPIDCGVTPDVQAEVDACVATATLCNPFEEAVPRDQWTALLDVADPTTVTPYSPIQFLYVPTNETVDRVSCVGLVANDTLANGTLVYVCIQRFFCFIDPEAVVDVALSGVCAASAVSFPGVLAIYYTGPATIVGGNLYIDPRYPTSIFFDGITFDGGGTTSGFFDSCMQNSNLTITNSIFYGWQGDYVLRVEGCDYAVSWRLDNVTMIDVPGTALYLEGLDTLEIIDFTCERCAQRPNTYCGYFKLAWTASRRFSLIDSSCWRVQDLLPPRCRYCLTGDDGFCGSRCDEGIVEAYNRRATEAVANCPLTMQTIRDYWTNTDVMIEEFDPICRVYSLPVCNFITALDSQNYTRTFTFPGGDIIWNYDAPLICAPNGTISPLTGPFFVAAFDNALGDMIVLQPIDPLPPSPGFIDGAFEDVGLNWDMTPGALVVATANPPALSPTHAMQCDNGVSRSAEQSFDVRPGDVGFPQSFAIYARPDNSPGPGRYSSRYMRLYIDNVLIDSIGGGALHALITPGSYAPIIFAPWVAGPVGTYTVRVECDFNGGSGALRLRLDDASWTATSTLFTQPLLDGTFEPHILTWTDSPQGQVIRSKAEDGIDCNARSGTYRYTVGAGQVHQVVQDVTFPAAGVFGITGWMQRRASAGNYAGLTVTVIANNAVVGNVDIPAVLPNQDEWTFVEFIGQIVVPTPGTTLSIGLLTDFTSVGGPANLCIDDLELLAVGNVGIVPDTLGFSAQQISSAPNIINKTCSCDAYVAPPRNATELPCRYALTDEWICVEEVASCCAADWLNRAPLVDSVFWLGTCNDLNDPACVFLADCWFTPGGAVLNCTQFSCPNMTGSGVRPLPDEPNVDYLYGSCTAAVVTVANGTWVLGSLVPGVAPAGQWSVAYSNVDDGVVFVDDTLPGAFYVDCAEAGNEGCTFYGNCASVTYVAIANFFSINGCDLLNCTQPPGAPPTTVAEFATCSVLSSGNAVTVIDGGWVFRADGAAEIFDEAAWRYWLAARDAGETTFVVGPRQYGLLATACTPHAYFRVCPCLTPGSYLVPADADPLAPGSDTFYSCADGVSSCRCNTAAIDDSNPAPAGTVSWWIANAPDTLDTLRIINNRGQQHEAAWVVEQLSYELLASNTIVLPQRRDDAGICRLLLQNDNEFSVGTMHDCFEGNPGGPYTTWCDVFLGYLPLRIPCPIPLTAQSEADCFVDDRATDDLPDFGVTIFNVIQDAVNKDNCDSIYIRFSTASAYFEEDIRFDKENKNLILWSLEGAIIVGRHTIDTNTNNLTFVGLRFIVPGDNQNPLFEIDKEDASNLEFLVILNSEIDGSGCRKCGIVNTKRLNDIVVNWTSIIGFEFFALKLDDGKRLVLAHNQVIGVTGRAFLIKVSEGFVIDSNNWIDTRGGADLKGAAIVSVTATDIAGTCSGVDLRHTCLFRNNQQTVNITQVTPRFQDVCYYFSRGLLNITTVYDNVCRIAENGFVFNKMTNIGAAELTTAMELNPLVRPSLTQIRDPDNPLFKGKLVGTDYVLRSTTSFVTPNNKGDFVFSNNVEVDYDEFPFQLPIAVIRCEANRNWNAYFGFGTAVVTERMGVQRFSNVSIGVEYCQDRRVVPPVLGGDPAPAFILYVRSFNGSRLTPERLTVQRDAWLYGDDTDACCRIPEWRPAIVGNAHRLLVRRFNATLITSAMPVDPLPFSMWSSGPLDYPVEVTSSQEPTTELIPAELCWDNVEFDGRNILPEVQMFVLDLITGELLPTSAFRPQSNKLPPETESFFDMHDSFVRRLLSLDAGGATGGGNYVNVPGRYPFFDAIRITLANRINTMSVVKLLNNVFSDIDRNGIILIAANEQYLENNTFNNCSGRAAGNNACVRLEGNDVSQLIGPSTKKFDAAAVFYATVAILHHINNTYLNTRPVLFELDSQGPQAGYVPALRVESWPNTTDYCIINSTSSGLPLGARQLMTANFTLLQCSLYAGGPTTPTFPDNARFLREQCVAGNLAGMQGTVHDLAYGIPQTDFYAETIWCDSTLPDFPCCPLVTPPRCWVVQTPSLLQPSNPWFGVYVFGSLSTAITDCAARAREIVVVGSSDPFGTGDTSNKVYTEVISATVPVVGLNGTTGPLLIKSGSGVTWASAGNSIDTQCVFTTFEGFRFEHPGTPGIAIWEQTAGLCTDACNLRFLSNEWRVDVDELAMNVLVGDNFTLSLNQFRGSVADLTRNGVRLVGCACTAQPVVVVDNEFDDYTGYGLFIDAVGQYVVRNNDFENVGGRDALTQTPFSVYVSVCTAPPLTRPNAKVRFENNRVRTTQTVPALVGNMATCWLGNVPLQDKPFYILDNDCRGLEFGIRFETMPDTSPSNDPKQQLRQFALSDGNINSKGFQVPPLNKRFDLVRGPPADDASLTSDPQSSANKGRWCTDGCPTDQMGVIWAIVALIAACLLFWLLCALATGCCTPRRLRDPLLSFSTTNQPPPVNPALYGNGYVSPFDSPLQPLLPGRVGPMGAEISARRTHLHL